MSQSVGMIMLDRGKRAEQARAELARVLPDATVGEPDETGTFEITLAASDREAALHQVWNAIAAAGADDHVAFIEHPDIPGHWRVRKR